MARGDVEDEGEIAASAFGLLAMTGGVLEEIAASAFGLLAMTSGSSNLVIARRAAAKQSFGRGAGDCRVGLWPPRNDGGCSLI